MFINLVILTLALTIDGQVHAGKIFGGHVAVPHSRPYMVLLQRHTPGHKPEYCDGFLLNRDFVMTAAHCQARSYSVLLGLHNFHHRSETQNVSVEEAFLHKDYNAADFKNDIMILKLSSKANFTKNVKTIDLEGQSDGSLPKACSVCGWGLTDKNKGQMSIVLMEVNVTLIDKDRCPQENAYCSEGQTGPRKGDSGGPLVCEDGEAYGVVSTQFTPYSGGPKIYIFTKISHYRTWINSTMEFHGIMHSN